MTDDNQSDAQALPPTEFDVRGIRGADGIPGDYMVGRLLFDTAFSAPIMTADKVRDRIHAASLSIEALMVIEAPTFELQRAVQSVHAGYAYVVAHQAAMISQVEIDEANARYRLDEEDVALASAAAALGDASTA